MASGRILVVDDDPSARNELAKRLRDEGLDVETAADGLQAVERCESFAPHVVITDIDLPKLAGVELVKRLCAMPDAPAVVVMTAPEAIARAFDAMRAGAVEYLREPVDGHELDIVVDRVLAIHALRADAAELRRRVRDRVASHNMIGTSPPMQRVFEIIEQVAATRATVLITGEIGTGKELVANAIHERSPRAARPFIKVHCAALAERFLESELFGSEHGSFGERNHRDGRFAIANGGTLFLDEVGETTPALQAKLLRVLQHNQFERLGGTETLQVDVRVIAATERDLADEVARGRFRQDLFYRLSVVDIATPPLRDRVTDIPALASYFVERYARESGKRVTTIAPQALELLASYPWPGNVRELETAIEHAVVLADSAMIEARHLPPTVRPPAISAAPPIPGSTIDALERYAILETMKATGGSTSRAAEMLGISARTIQYRMHAYEPAEVKSPPAPRNAVSRGR